MFEKIGAVIPEKVWITKLDESAHSIMLEGYAASEDDISEFLRGLQKKRDLGVAELVVAEMKKSVVKDRVLFSFKIRIER
jgi:Tfp pilus assembly protein PilN